MPTTIRVSDPTRSGNLYATVHGDTKAETRRATKALEANAKAEAPIKSGATRASVSGKVQTQHTGRVFVGTKQAGFTNWGTRNMKADPWFNRAARQTAAEVGGTAVVPKAPSIRRGSKGKR